MERIALIFAIAVATYTARISGFVLAKRSVPPVLDRFLDNVPVAVFAALIAPDVGVGGAELAPRILGAVAAAIVVFRVRQLWAGLAVGMAVYWLTQLATGTLT